MFAENSHVFDFTGKFSATSVSVSHLLNVKEGKTFFYKIHQKLIKSIQTRRSDRGASTLEGYTPPIS
jgi:hypothetical protein